MRPTISIVAGLVWGATANSRKSSSAIVKRAIPQLIQNGDFSTGLSGWTVEPVATPKNGRLCVSVPPGTANGYVLATYTFELVKNDVYTLKFTAAASVAQNIGIQTPDSPLDPSLNTTAALSTTAYPFPVTFSPANQAPNAILWSKVVLNMESEVSSAGFGTLITIHEDLGFLIRISVTSLEDFS